MKQENAKREYNDTKKKNLFYPTSFSFSFVFFLSISEDKQKQKSREFFCQAYFVAFAKLVKVP
jgi:hypothetical protein